MAEQNMLISPCNCKVEPNKGVSKGGKDAMIVSLRRFLSAHSVRPFFLGTPVRKGQTNIARPEF
jgi:hypothetical protein